MALDVDERGLRVEALAVGGRAALEVEVDLVLGRDLDRGAERAGDLGERETHAIEGGVHAVAVDLDPDPTDLLGLAERLAPADRRLLSRHRHEQRVLALLRTVSGSHTEPSRSEDGDAGAHVDRRETDSSEWLRHFERLWEDLADHVGVCRPDHGHRCRPDGRADRLDLAIALRLR